MKADAGLHSIEEAEHFIGRFWKTFPTGKAFPAVKGSGSGDRNKSMTVIRA